MGWVIYWFCRRLVSSLNLTGILEAIISVLTTSKALRGCLTRASMLLGHVLKQLGPAIPTLVGVGKPAQADWDRF